MPAPRTREEVADLIRSLNSQVLKDKDAGDAVLVVADAMLQVGAQLPAAVEDYVRRMVNVNVGQSKVKHLLVSAIVQTHGLDAWSSLVQWTQVPWALFDRLVANARQLKHMLLVGAGTTMVARRLAHISTGVPYPSIGTTSVGPTQRQIFRAPHHTVSVLGMASEMSLLEEGGLLYLEDMPEFTGTVLDVVVTGLRSKRVFARFSPGRQRVNNILVVGSVHSRQDLPSGRPSSTTAHSARLLALLDQMDVIDLPNESFAMNVWHALRHALIVQLEEAAGRGD